MQSYDVFNGDADGICALIQLRLAEPRESVLVTGVKRDISLLRQLPLGHALDVTALDISLDKNREALEALLLAGSRIFYCDHHYPGEEIPSHPAFTALIDTGSSTCTSLLVDRHLKGRFHHWAIVAAFGDNLNAVAEKLSAEAGLSSAQAQSLQHLGICVNYNGYGAALPDLHYHPADLFQALLPFSDPLMLMAEQPEVWRNLSAGYAEDMSKGLGCRALHHCNSALVVVLPDEAWARRVSGVLGNELANRNPDQACAVVTDAGGEHLQVSIRAPLNNRKGADDLARRFPTGGGRQAAAGINELPYAQLEDFVAAMAQQWR